MQRPRSIPGPSSANNKELSTVVRKVIIPVPLFQTQGLCPPSQPSSQMPVKCFTSYRHLQLVEGVLHHVVRIQLVDLVHDCLHVAGHGIREEQELGACQCLETGQAEPVRLEVLQPCSWDARVGIAVARGCRCVGAGGGGGGGGGRRGEREFGCDRASDGMDTVGGIC